MVAAGVVANYTFVHARWLTVLTAVGWVLLCWRVAWENDHALRRFGAGRVMLRGNVVMAVTWSLTAVGPVVIHYPPLLYRANAVVGAVAIVFLLVVLAAPRRVAAAAPGSPSDTA